VCIYIYIYIYIYILYTAEVNNYISANFKSVYELPEDGTDVPKHVVVFKDHTLVHVCNLCVDLVLRINAHWGGHVLENDSFNIRLSERVLIVVNAEGQGKCAKLYRQVCMRAHLVLNVGHRVLSKRLT
jgi:hypothetical protein